MDGKTKLILFVIIGLIFKSITIGATTFFVSLRGNDNNSGLKNEPFATIEKAIDFLSAGDLIFDNRGGANRGVVYITDEREDYAIGVNNLGKIKVYKYHNVSWN